uniref:phage protein NinX family protein n=1 Tax=Hafnia alvei TaxID=569 RepID=UPI002432B1BD|nr:phage protein NinX family protein [Hafnia alvei]
MTDYSKMSDFEINKAVAIQLGMKPFCETTGWQGLTSEPYVDVIVRGAGRMGAFNPCNNPLDAWPILKEYCIDINWDGDSDSDPLRDAMIVYLMMKESENG